LEARETPALVPLLVEIAMLIFAPLLAWKVLQSPAPLFQVTAGDAAVQLYDLPGGVFGLMELAHPVFIEVRADSIFAGWTSGPNPPESCP
jgi:hypothetical protein